MAIGPDEIAAILAGVGALFGGLAAVARPFFKHMTERRYVERARPEDLPVIAKAMHPQIELRKGSGDNGDAHEEPVEGQSQDSGSDPPRLERLPPRGTD